jgi:uroporphyrinogen-III synthase
VTDGDQQPLAGRLIGITAERKGDDQADLFIKRGADVIVAPMLHTVDLADDEALRLATVAFTAESPDWFLATTGFGVRLWLETAELWGLRVAVVEALARVPHVVARGPKSRSALRQVGVDPEWTAPGESMPEVVTHVARELRGGERVAVQLFDPDEHPTTLELRGLVGVGGSLLELGVYRWEPPLDQAAAHQLVELIARSRVDAVTFTSQPAVHFLFKLAAASGGVDRQDEVRTALDTTVHPVCIGPVCADAAVARGVSPERVVWPDPFRLVPMVKLTTELLAR